MAGGFPHRTNRNVSTSIAYSWRGRTMAQYSGIKAVVDSSETDRLTMNGNRLDVYTLTR